MLSWLCLAVVLLCDLSLRLGLSRLQEFSWAECGCLRHIHLCLILLHQESFLRTSRRSQSLPDCQCPSYGNEVSLMTKSRIQIESLHYLRFLLFLSFLRGTLCWVFLAIQSCRFPSCSFVTEISWKTHFHNLPACSPSNGSVPPHLSQCFPPGMKLLTRQVRKN